MFIVNFIIKGINAIFGVVGHIITLLLMVFPNSPFVFNYPAEVEEILGKANYFIPVNEMILISEAWLVSIGIFYAYSVYARWAKTIQ